MRPQSPKRPPSAAVPALRRPRSMMVLNQHTAVSSRASSVASTRPSSAQVFKGTILVSVRTKPESADVEPQWSVHEDAETISHETAGEFSFDNVYNRDASNAEVFDHSVKDLIHKVAQGYNGTVFAYGMTGSGKTFSMQGSPENPGVISKSVDLLFELISQSRQAHTVKVAYMEIYNERVGDLLSNDDSVEITLRDDPIRGVKAIGLTEVTVRNASELHSQIAQGDMARRTSSTQFNLHSSRSHAVVQISITCGDRQSVLYLCDLAGSERAVNEVQRRKEGAYINKSLLTLSTIISRLSTGGGGHVPFRDSKLTRLLQPSLSGNALVSVLCTVQTNAKSYTETLSTLRFAARAKNIVVIARKNSIIDDSNSSSNQQLAALLAQQKSEIAQLKLENAELVAVKEDLQGQLDMYMKMNDTMADESLDSLLDASTRQSVGTDSQKEIDRLNEQITDLIHKLAESQHEVQRSKHLTHPDVAMQDLLDEISELKETIDDKNQVINYLRGSSERRKAINTLASPGGSKSRMSYAPMAPSWNSR